ncbi:MarR family EPS-associated transcriptional regulator [Pusillimonas minor]|uniref:MarR family EPS-associated transcriptional regulator n=1 Tax=Pusillimonas minor TaxID=2697024 RepID=A0A842HQT0_9BURK|nr:MarR family EPS-associated transcriptional regulator [Pusillimonas minor]MBC2770566.1 MarR family EPS-associated transcriptional regulator [Pusillimonas minor]
MPSRQAQQQEDTTFRVLRILEQQPELSQRELAKQLGVSASGVNYCLKALVEKGWVKVQNFSQSKNKLGYAYVLTPSGVAHRAGLTGRFLKRKMQEYEALRAEIEALKSEPSVAQLAEGAKQHD